MDGRWGIFIYQWTREHFTVLGERRELYSTPFQALLLFIQHSARCGRSGRLHGIVGYHESMIQINPISVPCLTPVLFQPKLRSFL